MNWLILIGNDHSQTIENAELARNARRYCQNYTRILTLSSKAQTLLPVQEHGRLAGHGLSGCLYYLDQSQLCLLSLELYWQTRKQQHPLHSAACSFSRVPIFPKTAFKALPQIGPSSSRLMRHGVVRMPSSYPESLCSPSLPPTSDNCTGHCKALAPAWDALTRDYKDSDTLLVTEVDCTSDTGKGLCSERTLLLASLLASETLVPISRKRGSQLQL